MALRARLYKDKEKLIKTRNAQRKRYYQKTINVANSGRRWEEDDIEMVIYSSLTDMELSKLIQRSVGAIQVMRNKQKKEGVRK